MARNKKLRQSVGLRKTPRKATCHTPKVTKPRLVIDLSGRKQRKQLLKNREIRRQILGERKRPAGGAGSSSSNRNNISNNRNKNSPSRHMILYPPVPPPPPPGRATSSRSGSAQRNKKSSFPPRRCFDTITVIDSEDEGSSVGVDQDAIPIFYEDRKGGFDDREVPRYISHTDDVQLLEETLEEGEIREEDADATIMNVEAIPENETEDEVIQVDDSTAIELTVPLPKCEDQSVIFCSEVIDLSREVDRNRLLDYIPIGYDPDPAEVGQRSPRKKSKKGRGEKQTEQPVEQSAASTAVEDAPRSTKRMVVIDGNNVAYAHCHGEAFSVKGLEICINHFKNKGHNVQAVVPQFRQKKDKSTDQKLLDELFKAKHILFAPCKNLPGQRSSSYDDRLIIQVAEAFDAVIISNDNFRDLLAESDSWKKIIETRVIGYTWAENKFFLPNDPYGRHGPKLQDLLEYKKPDAAADAAPTATTKGK